MEFSFSGLKTAVKQTIYKTSSPNIADIAASFQDCVISTLLEKAMASLNSLHCKKLVLCGGVMSNQTLVSHFSKAAIQNQFECFNVPPLLCTDNAAMIASAGFFYRNKGVSRRDLKIIKPLSNLEI